LRFKSRGGRIQVVGEADDLRARLEHTLRRLALCSTVPGRAFIGAVHQGRPGSMAPTEEHSPAERYADEAARAGDDVGQLRVILRRADGELHRALRRPLAEVKTETLEELEQPHRPGRRGL
jgi:hypothetical protein